MPLKHQDTKSHKILIISYLYTFSALVLWWQKTTYKIVSINTKFSIVLLLLIFLSSCSSPQKKENNKVKQSGVKYAKGFSLESNEHFKKLSILNPWDNYKPYAIYYVLKDSLKPEAIANELTFYFQQTPKTIALHTAAQEASLKALNLDKDVKGITDPRFFYESEYSEKLKRNELIQTSNQIQINKERILLLQPDLVITSGWNTISADHQLLIKMGIPPLFMIEWMETDPLGRAEWIKAIGLLFDKEKEADSLFKLVETNYMDIKNKQMKNTYKPKVLHGEEYNGVWYVAGGESYIAQLYADAGADYLWRDNEKSGSLALDIEVVLERSIDADFWFTTFGQNLTDIEHIKQEKYSILKSVKSEAIYSNTNRTRIMGGNDFWETGSLRPDLVLKDIVQILQADTESNDSLFFYKKLDLN